MPKKLTSKRTNTSKNRSVKRKKRNNRSPSIGFLLIMMIVIIIIIVTVINHVRRTESEIVVPMITEEVRSEEPDPTDDIESAIKHTAEQLGVPSHLLTKRFQDGQIHYNLQIDRARLDLNFANMIVTGHIELAGGTILKGEEVSRGSSHVLTVLTPDNEKEYIVRLSYARSGNYPQKFPQLAIIVDDFGEYAGDLLDEFLATDINVTFAILPHLRYSREVMDRAVETGREVMLHMPMEPIGYPRADPGINPILVEHTEKEINRIMQGYLRNLPKISGANNHMGSLATTDSRVMDIVLKFLKQHNLYFADSKTTNMSVGYEMAQKMVLPSVSRDMFLDVPDSSEETFMSKIEELKSMKHTKDQVVVITHCFDRQRLTMLNRFIEEAKKLGFELVPVSQLFITDLPEIL